MEREENKENISKGIESLTNELLFCYEELDFIYESGNMLSSIASGKVKGWKDVSNNILDSALDVFKADIGWVFFVNKKGQNIDIEEARGIAPARAEALSSSFASQVMEGIFQIDNPPGDSKDESTDGNPAILIFAPFKSGEKFFGAIALGRSNNSAFNTHHMKLLRHFSAYSAQVLENAKMFQEINHAYQLSQEANKRLKKLNEMKENLISITSHELRTPLHILSMCMDMIKNEGLGESKDNYDFLVPMEDALSRLDKIINNICKLSRIEEGSFAMVKERFDIRQLIEIIQNEMNCIFKKRDINLHIDIMPDLKMLGDIEMIRDVISELLLNALKHTPDGGDIEVIGENSKGGTVIKIIDSGTGIPEEEKAYIFEKFYKTGGYLHHKSGTHEYKSGGICIGLATAKAIVDKHRGRIWVESPSNDSRYAKGCNFSLCIPNNDNKQMS